MGSRKVYIRLTVIEDSILDQACDALDGLEKSQLVQEAVLSEANRLGIRWSVERPRRSRSRGRTCRCAAARGRGTGCASP